MVHSSNIMCIARVYAGHVTIGGSICMQMLTRSGWTPSNDIEVCQSSHLEIQTAVSFF